jgi:hypothetical protein
MALHRDIYWVGRQWTVTGYGIQACDQRQKGKFDIEATRLWDDGVLESTRDLTWLDIVDFEKAIVVARKYYPEPARKVAPPEARVLGLIAEVSRKPSCQDIDHQDIGDKDIGHNDVGHKEIEVARIEKPRLATQRFELRAAGWPAKFVPQWRIRIQR